MRQRWNIEPFHELAANQQRLVRRALRLYAQEVAAIHRSRGTDLKRIEHQLDGMLGFCFDAKMLLLFKMKLWKTPNTSPPSTSKSSPRSTS